MSLEIFGQNWAESWVNNINSDTQYRSVASNWKHPVCFNLIENDKTIRSLFLDLFEGKCRSFELSEKDLSDRAEYLFEAELDKWEALIEEQQDPIYSIMRGRIRLNKGNMLTLSRQAKAGKRLLQLCPVGHLNKEIPKQAVDTKKNLMSGSHESFKSTSKGIDFDAYPMQLFQKAKKLGIWNPSSINFSQDVEDWNNCTESEQEIITHLTALFIAGEESVTSDILPLISAVARDGYLEDEIYLTSFLWEEAKHTEFFAYFLEQVGINGSKLDHYHSPNYRKIFYEELPLAMESLYTDQSASSQIRASVTYNMIVEGTLAETGYQAYYKMLDEANIMPGLKEGIGHLKRDESRHIAYGLYLIGRHLKADPSLMRVVNQRMEELVEPAIGFINEIFDYYNDNAPFGLKRENFIDYAMNQFTKRMAKLEQIASQQNFDAQIFES